MCTVVILRRPGHPWPILLAANRDEMAERPWRPPARHWPARAEVIAGIDELAGGTWLGINDSGLIAGLLNRRDSLGPDPRLRSRGELVLEALDHADADLAAEALAGVDGGAYRAFNMVIADNRDAFWLRSLGGDSGGKVEAFEIPEGLSMITSLDLNDPASPRIQAYLPRFAQAAVPDPGSDDWAAWEALMADRGATSGQGSGQGGPAKDPKPARDGTRGQSGGEEPGRGMAVAIDRGYGTLSGSLIALPAIALGGIRPKWRFAAGLPGRAPYEAVEF